MIKNYPTLTDYASMTIETIDQVRQAIYDEIASSPHPSTPPPPLPDYTAWQTRHEAELRQMNAAIVARGGSIAEQDAAMHAYVDAHPHFEGMYTAPGVLFEAQLTKPPALTMNKRGELAAAIDGEDYCARPVYEVAHLHYHGLVVISTDAAVFVLTAEEWSAQV